MVSHGNVVVSFVSCHNVTCGHGLVAFMLKMDLCCMVIRWCLVVSLGNRVVSCVSWHEVTCDHGLYLKSGCVCCMVVR